MSTQAEESTPTPQVVGNAFVEQYYNLLSQSPEMVHKFYHNSGIISRPESDGDMKTASTLEGIEKMMLSHDCKNCVVQILTTDAQESFGDGVIVLVTGYFTGKDSNRKKFTQLFFLAPQASNRAAFSVLNDVLRYVDDEEAPPVKINDADDTAPTAPLTPDPEPTLVNTLVDHSTEPLEVEIVVANEASHPLENGEILAADKEVSIVSVDKELNDDSSISVASIYVDAQPVSDDTVAPVGQDDAPKKSYASVANALNYKKQPFQQRALPPKPVAQPRATTVTVAPEAPPRQVSVKSVEKNYPAIVKGYSIFVANLPMDATVEQLIEAFEKFGPIKPNGVQVRSYKIEKNCFGFVEFESASSMQSAVEVSSLKIGDRMAHIEEKKANNEGGKFANRKGSFRGDNFRSRGNFGGGRGGYGRNEFDNQPGSSGQSRGGGGRRGGNFNQKVSQNGSGRQEGQGHARADAQPEPQVEGGKS